MISISGHAGTGKTTAGDILTEEGFWVFDSGAFWREFRDTIAPGMNVGELHFAMREYTGDEHWEDKFLAAVVRNEYDRGMSHKKDLIMVGYRSLEELDYVFDRLEGHVFPERQRTYIHFTCPFDLAVERVTKRDGMEWTEEDLRLRYETERARGLDDFLNVANIIIENDSNSVETLRETVTKVVYEDLGYPKETVEGQIRQEGSNRRVVEFFSRRMDLDEDEISRHVGKERK